MSLGAEIVMEQMINYWTNAYTPPVWWRMKNGKSIRISDMTTEHLVNTIKMLRRQIDGSAHDDFIFDNVAEMEKELRKRGYDVIRLKVECFPHLADNPMDMYDDHNNNKRERILIKMGKIKNVDLKVVGVTFKNSDGSSRAEKIIEISQHKDSAVIKLERESSNLYDPNAIKVLANGRQIGYVGKDYSGILAPMMDNEFREFSAKVKDCGEYKGRPYCQITINEI